MEIQVGKFRLRSDERCFWIEEGYTVKKKDGKKDIDYRRVAGYSRTIPHLFESFCEHRWRNNDAKDMAELLKVLTQTWKDMEEMNKAAVKEDFRMMKATRKKKGEE